MPRTPKSRRVGVPADIAAINKALADALNTVCENGSRVGDAKFGTYAFYDYDGEPIYVGQTSEKIRVRVRRHLTNHRTDAVAMNVLDPFEVAEIELWPLWEYQAVTKKQAEQWKTATEHLNQAEYAAFQRLLADSKFKALLNEKDIAQVEPIELPTSIRVCIIPEHLRCARSHPDVRIARRAATIASLAKVISERDVSPGLRRTLLTQAKRLENLAQIRFATFADDPIEIERADEDG